MAETESAIETDVDLDAILDSALEAPKPKGRPKTKTEMLRERRGKLIALRAKGYTESELAQMTGVSKDTLRKALKPTKSGKAKRGNQAAHAAKPSTIAEKVAEKVAITPPRVANVAGANGDEKSFPTNARF